MKPKLLVLFFKHFVVFVTISCIYSCKQLPDLVQIKGRQLQVTDSLSSVSEIDEYIQPYRTQINQTLDSVLAYNPSTIDVYETPLNTALGNFMVDVVYERSAPIYQKRTGNTVDFAFLNHGGIRSKLNKGAVTARNAYELMPFENTVVVLELTADHIEDMARFLAKSRRAHPFSDQFRLILNKDYSIKSVTVHGQPLDKNRVYRVATSNYLANLGDRMVFFSNPVSRTETDYLIRNTLIDHFAETDTIKAQYDNRFIIE